MANSFIEKMAVLYQAEPSPLLVSIRLAQACLESHYGNSDLARYANNYAGIKASLPWIGESYTKTTKEEINGVLVDVKGEKFRKYPNIEAFIKDHSNFIISTEYRKKYYKKVIEATTYQGQAAALTGTYATDSAYGRKLIELIECYDLTKYDAIKAERNENMFKQPKRKNIDLFSKYTGRTGKRTGVIIHNDAGRPTGLGYEPWLRTSRANTIANAERGFAHEYVSNGEILQVQPLDCPAWAAANSMYNNSYYHIEVCQQLSTSDKDFLLNEEYAIMRTAEVCQQFNIVPSRKTFTLHTYVSKYGTSCPQRSSQLHGGYDKTLDYFIDRTKHYMAIGKTIEQMIGNVTSSTQSERTYIDAPSLSSNAKAFDELKIGQTVTIREGQTMWYIPQKNQVTKPSKDFKGDKDVIEKAIEINASYSKRAYLLKGKRSWILEQDLVEARNSWKAIEVDDEVKPKLPKGNYAYIEGKYYEVKEIK